MLECDLSILQHRLIRIMSFSLSDIRRSYLNAVCLQSLSMHSKVCAGNVITSIDDPTVPLEGGSWNEKKKSNLYRV